jgi:hypothetical protein
MSRHVGIRLVGRWPAPPVGYKEDVPSDPTFLTPAEDAMAQTAQIEFEYLMTVHADLDPPHLIDAGSRIVNVRGGWADGPKIKARITAPGADWLQMLPSGATRIDVRLTMVTEDEQPISISYNGVIAHSEQSAAKVASGTLITHADAAYFMIAPTFRTGAEKYAWLNRVQAVGKMVQLSFDPANRFVRYDFFVVR